MSTEPAPELTRPSPTSANSETVNCFVDPCLNFETRCPRAARCVPIYCSVKPCGRLLYDRALNVLNESACSAPTPRPKRASKKLDLEIPRWHKPEQSGECTALGRRICYRSPALTMGCGTGVRTEAEHPNSKPDRSSLPS